MNQTMKDEPDNFKRSSSEGSQQKQYTGNKEKVDPTTSFHRNRGSVFGPAMSGTRTSVEIPIIHKVFQQIAADYSLKSDFVVECLMLDDTDLAIPAVLLAVKEGGNRVWYSAILLSNLVNGTLPDYFEKEGGYTFQLPQTEESLWPGLMARKALALIGKTYFGTTEPPEGVVVECSVQVLPRTGVYNTAETCRVPFDHSITALISHINLSRGRGTSTFANVDLVEEGLGLVVQSKIHGGSTTLSTLNKPLACDFELILTAKPKVPDTSLHQLSNDVPLTKVSGTIDFMLIDCGSEERRHSNRKITYPVVAPVFIIRQSTSVGHSSKNTDSLLTQIFGLLMLKMFSEQTARWGQVFEPGLTASETNDIGALGLVGNPYQEQDVLLEKHTVLPRIVNGGQNGQGKTVVDLLNEYCSEYPVLAIDLMCGGPLEAIQDFLVRPGSHKAIARELSAFVGRYENDSFTFDVDEFARYWGNEGGTDSVPVLDPNRPLNEELLQYEGEFPGADNMLHDIQEVDMLYLLGQSGSNHGIIQDYQKNHTPGSNSTADLSNRIKPIKDMLDHATITGKSRRFFINPVWIQMVGDFLLKHKVVVDMDEGLITQGSIFGITRSHLTDTGRSNMFRTSGSNSQGGGLSRQFTRTNRTLF